MIVIATYTTRLDAEIAKGALETNGVKAIIVSDDAGGMRPFPLAPTIGVALHIHESDEIVAKDVLHLR